VALVLAAPLALTAIGGGQRAATAAGVGDCTPAAGWGTVRSDLAAEVIGLVNQHRAGLGLGGLAQSATLTAAAVWKAQHMAAYGYFSHEDPAPPVARSVGDRVAACGYTASWGENIAYGYPAAASVMQGWLSSPGHKANIERTSFQAIGVGVAVAANGTHYWVQDFGTLADSGSPPPPPASPPPAAPPPSPPPAPPTPPPTPKAPAAAPKPTPSAPSPPTPPAPTKTAAAPATTAPVAATKVPATRKVLRSPHLETSRLLEWGGRPRAGRKFTGRLMISLPGTHERVRTGHATCKAHARGHRVWVGIHRFKEGFVVCRWWVPKTARNHRLIGTIRVNAGGNRTARWFSRVVR
jgi:uncharacterized protein YkwD